ncbi:MAG: SPOR domain-containing protein [Pseudomonadales bacterium]|nr:SPOR domain-containing protein [Pseudomonadales bacterium]
MDDFLGQEKTDEQLRQAMHLIHYGHSILVVDGPISELKFDWLHELERQCIDDQHHLCAIELSDLTDALQMLSMLALGFGIPYQNADIGILSGLLHDFQLAQQHRGKSVVLIRNADLLDASTSVHVQRLSELEGAEESFQFVLVGNNNEGLAKPVWSTLPNLFEIVIESDEVEVPEPQSFQAHLDETLLHAREEKPRSPQFFSLFAEAMKQKTVFGFPRLHLAILSIVVVTILFALLMTDKEVETTEPTVSVTLEVPKIDREMGRPATAQAELSTTSNAKPTQPDQKENAHTTGSGDEGKTKALPGSVTTVNKIENAEVVVENQPPEELMEPEQAVMNPDAIAVAEISNKKLEPKATQLQKFERQLLELDPKTYTLQLYGAYEENKASDFIKKYPQLSDLRYYRGQFKGRAWYTVVTGVYADANAASKTVKKLPNALQRQKPWPRTLKGIQSSIRSHMK